LGLIGLMAASLLIALLFIWPRLPNLAAQAVGFQERGPVAAVYENAAPLPTPVVVNLAPAGPITFTLGDLGGGTLSGTEGVAVQLGSDAASGAATAVIRFTEAELLALCDRYADICRGDPRIQNPRVDLRPGGAVVYADVTLPELANVTQTVGVALRVDSSGRALEVEGLDIGGYLYLIPSNDIGQMILNAEAQLNQALQQAVIDTTAGRMTLDRISIDDSVLTLSMR
jgi:hypothetical protein